MTTETYDKKPKFDPNKSFEPDESGKPAFDPNKSFEEDSQVVKKKVGSVSFPELESAAPSISKTPNEIIALANEFNKISGRVSAIEQPIYGTGYVGTPKATSRDKGKLTELEGQIKEAGYDPKEVIAEFGDFPIPAHEVDVKGLLKEKKENPLSYERHKAAYKWQVPLFNSIRQNDPENADGVIQLIMSGQSGGDYDSKRAQTKTAIEAANKYIQDDDERRKVIQRIQTDKSFSYGIDDESKLNAVSQDERYLGGSGLNKYQIQGLQFLEDTDPEKAKLYSDRVGKRPESVWGDADIQRGYEYKARNLESFGMQLELKALQEKLTDFKNKKSKGELTPEEAQQYVNMGGQYETLLQDIDTQNKRFPKVAAIEADQMYQEAMGQRNGAVKRVLLGTGENVGDALNTVNDFLMSPFRSKEERIIDDLEDLGSKKFTDEVQRYKTAANELIGKDGKLNLTTGAVANTVSDVAAEIVSSIGIGSVTGMPATKAGRIGSLFSSTFATAYNDYYTEAIEKDIQNPTTYALLHSTKEALSELINNDYAVLNKFVNPKSTLAQIAKNITKKEWDDIALKGAGRFTKALKAAERIGVGAAKNAFKEDVEEVAAQIGGNLINMGVYHENVDAMEGVGATIINTTLGTLPFGGLGVVGEIRSMNRNQKYALYEAAQNKEKYLTQLDIDVKNGAIDEKKAEQIKAIIEHSANVLNELSEKNTINEKKTDNEKVEILAKEAVPEVYTEPKKESSSTPMTDQTEGAVETSAVPSNLETEETQSHVPKIEEQQPSEIPVTPETESAATATANEIIPPTEEGKGATTEGEENLSGITHAATADVREKLGLPEYEGLPKDTHENLIAEAKKTIAENPNVANETMQKFRDGGKMNPKDNAVLSEYKAALDYQLENNPTKETFEKINELIKVLEPAGSEAGKLLESRKLLSAKENNLANFLLDKQIAQGTELTEQQFKSESAKYQELKEANERLEKQLAEEREQHLKDIAELGLNKAKAKAKKSAKKTDEEYKADRQAAVDAAREALKKLREGGLQSTIPGIRELQAIAPHVKTYLQVLANQGIDKLDNIITQVHAEFKDVLEGLTTSQVLDIVSGEHDAIKEKTRNEKANTSRLLKREAQLLKELQDARKGKGKAKGEAKVVASGRRIDELKTKIQEVRALNKNTDAEPVEDLTAGNGELIAKEEKRLQAKIQKLTTDLKEGNYLKETEKKPILTKSRKAQIMEDRVIDLENKIRHERSKDEYNKRSKWRKGFDNVMQILGIKRLVQTAIDMSTSFRQGATLISPTKIDVWLKAFQANLQSIFSPKKFERIMYAIRHDEQYHDMVKDGVVFNDLGSADPDLHNEDFRKSFLYNIPVISEPLKASNRSADAFLNVARYEMYKKFRRQLEMQGLTRESDPKAYKAAASWTMNMTGRGNMHSSLEKPAMNAVLGNTFYGARLMASRFNILNPLTYFDPRVPQQVKTQAMKDMAGFTVTVMAAGLALAAAGGKISLDPDDPDFLQVRFGDKVYDISGGLATYVRTFLRIVKAGYTKKTGTKYEGKKATEKAGMSTLNFFRNKLAPNTAYATDAFFGKAYGQELDPAEIYQIYPMYADDAIKAYQDEGMMSIPTVLLPNILGIGYGNYASKGQIDATLEDLLKRNMRSSEMNMEKIRNFKDKGRPITRDEFDDFADKRDAEIEKDINVLYAKGIGGTPYKELTQEEVADETSYIKAAATRKVKEELFGEQKKTHDEKRAAKELSKEREKKYKNN